MVSSFCLIIISQRTVYGSAFPEYLTWREKIFSSAGDNTSLLQMLPRWFSRAVRRLIQLYVQVIFILTLPFNHGYFIVFVKIVFLTIKKNVWMYMLMPLQGPLEWQSLAGVPTGESYLHFIDANEHTEITPMSWEETIQDYVEEELYASSLKVCNMYFLCNKILVSVYYLCLCIYLCIYMQT